MQDQLPYSFQPALREAGPIMSSITTGNEQQYSDSKKLAARGRLNREYTIAETGWFPWVARQLPLKPGDRVLDIGCGPAWFWASVANELPDDFDTVIAMHMLYHVADQAQALAEMHRVLKPGGHLAVTTNGAGNMRGMYALTTVFGSPPYDPAGAAFGYETAERLMQAQFGNVIMSEHPAHMRITEPEDVFLALTSYPPGDRADEAELAAFRAAISEAFRAGGGVLEVGKETGLFIGRKVG
jgi:hypothetical protein